MTNFTWDIKRIFRDLTDPDLRRRILTHFWKHADNQTRAMATAHLAKAMHFRDETIRKMPVEKKADLLASRLGAHEFDQYFEMGLMQYHTSEPEAREMMGAFLDLWNIPHVNGTIEAEEYATPQPGQVRDAVHQLEARYDRKAIALYLASAGLLMGGAWREATWPVADELTAPAR